MPLIWLVFNLTVMFQLFPSFAVIFQLFPSFTVAIGKKINSVFTSLGFSFDYLLILLLICGFRLHWTTLTSLCNLAINIDFAIELDITFIFYMPCNVMFQDSDSGFGIFDLLDPSSADKVVGHIRLSCSIEVCIKPLSLQVDWNYNKLIIIFKHLVQNIDRIQWKLRKVLQDESYQLWYAVNNFIFILSSWFNSIIYFLTYNVGKHLVLLNWFGLCFGVI